MIPRPTRIAETRSFRICRSTDLRSDRAAVRASAPRRGRGDDRRAHLDGTPWRIRLVSAHLDNMGTARRALDWIGVRPRAPGPRAGRALLRRRSTDNPGRRLQHVVRLLGSGLPRDGARSFRKRASTDRRRDVSWPACGSTTCSIGLRPAGGSTCIARRPVSAPITIRSSDRCASIDIIAHTS